MDTFVLNFESSSPPARQVAEPQLLRLLRPVAQPPSRALPCGSCRMRDTCVPGSLSEAAERDLAHVIIGSRRLRSGDVLVRQGEPVRFLHAVRVGTLKASTLLNDGREQVGAFLLGGDVLGFDALGRGLHQRTVIALEDSEVCSIPFAELIRLPAQAKGEVAWRMSELASAELAREQLLLAITGLRQVEPRLAAFLLWFSSRMRERGYSSREFELRMSRAELGSYLRVTIESVSRAMTALSEHGLIAVSKRRVRILSVDGLAALCEPALPAFPRPRDGATAALPPS